MSAMMMNNNTHHQTQQNSHVQHHLRQTQQPKAATLSLHDPEFKNLITVPLNAVHHLPPAHLEISRLVLCRKYDPREPLTSCPMGDSCKFVHIDMNTPQLQVQSIHVNYAYRNLGEVTHDRLPAGETLAVMAPNNRAPSQLVPSEMVIVTRGALQRHSGKGPLSHCAHYFYNRMCNRGDRCGFLHCLFVDEAATDFQRAPPRAGASHSTSNVHPHAHAHKQATVAPVMLHQPVVVGAAPAPLAHHVPASSSSSSSVPTLKAVASVNSHASSCCSCDLSESPRSHRSQATDSPASVSLGDARSPSSASVGSSTSAMKVYRHNPYSLIETTLAVASL